MEDWKEAGASWLDGYIRNLTAERIGSDRIRTGEKRQ